MPRAQQSLETRIVQHFNSAPIGEAVLLHRLIGENLKVRKAAEEAPGQPAAPARSRSRSNGGSKKVGKKKPAGKKKGGSRTAGASESPTDDELLDV